MEEWRTPPPLLSYDAPIGTFRVDDDIRKLSDKGWLGTCKLEDAVRFARRGLEIAIVEAQTEHEQNPSQIIPEWDKMAEHATSADKALGRLMHDLVVAVSRKFPAN